MNLKAPKIDTRDAKQIYDRAIELAKVYCPEWKPDEEDIGIALLRLFSRLTEIAIGQINRVPEKHLLAFYDFIGLDHLPPSPAKAPLTFNLSQGSKEAFVPARTRIASSQDSTVIFETMESLTAIAFNIKSAVSLNPWEDKYTNHSSDIPGCKDGFYIFGGDTHENHMGHILYIADNVFDSQLPADVSIKFTFSNEGEDFSGYFSACADGAGNPIITRGTFPTVNLGKVLIPKTTVDGVEGNWISFQPQAELPILSTVTVPEVTRITCDVSVSGIIPDAVFFNDTPVDVKKGFYPFGEMPKQGDAFYIGCEGAFSKTEASIILGIVSTDTASNDLKIAWEYWDGTKWAGIPDTNDSTIPSGHIEFLCPSVMQTTISGILSRWIRVRIDKGGYGKSGDYKEIKIEEIITDATIKSKLAEAGITSGYRYITPSYTPPFITSMSLGFTLTNKEIGWRKTYNNFKYQTITPESFQPFQPISETFPAFYLGFEDSLKNKPVSLYLSLPPVSYGDTVQKIKQQDYDMATSTISEKASGIAWKYYNGKGWTELAVTDGTDFFTKSDIIKFIVPSDISKDMQFGENLYWIKAEIKEGKWLEPPKLKGIFPNTVWAENAIVVKDELLGSSNGQTNQMLGFSSKPLLGKPVIEIREPGIPSKDELEVIKVEEGSDALRIVRDNSGEVQEVWVRWHEVATFVHSDSLSRHYIIDRVNGQVSFGDGIRGMITPPLSNNILAKKYQSGGGKKGNQPQKVIKGLKTTIPNTEGVTNPDSSSGGKDLEVIDNVLKRAPYSIKNRNRAVTGEDFEWLATEASPEVAKAKCIRNNENIKVIIAPDYEDGTQSPKASLTEYVETYLKERAFVSIRDSLEVVGPEYTSINIEATIVPVSISESAVVADRVVRRLRGFLNPLKGGQEGEGWNFGQDIFISEVAVVVEAVEGVDYIKELRVNSQDISEISFVSVADNELPCAGEISLTMSGGKD